MHPGEQWLFELFTMHLKELLILYVEGKISYIEAEKLTRDVFNWFIETFGTYHKQHVVRLIRLTKEKDERGEVKNEEEGKR